MGELAQGLSRPFNDVYRPTNGLGRPFNVQRPTRVDEVPTRAEQA